MNNMEVYVADSDNDIRYSERVHDITIQLLQDDPV